MVIVCIFTSASDRQLSGGVGTMHVDLPEKSVCGTPLTPKWLTWVRLRGYMSGTAVLGTSVSQRCHGSTGNSCCSGVTYNRWGYDLALNIPAYSFFHSNLKFTNMSKLSVHSFIFLHVPLRNLKEFFKKTIYILSQKSQFSIFSVTFLKKFLPRK